MQSLYSTLILVPYPQSNHFITDILSYMSFWNILYMCGCIYIYIYEIICIFQNTQTWYILYNRVYILVIYRYSFSFLLKDDSILEMTSTSLFCSQ